MLKYAQSIREGVTDESASIEIPCPYGDRK